MKRDQLKIGDSLNFHSEPEEQLERIVPYSIQNSTEHPDNHTATYIGDGKVFGALANGYKEQSLEEAISAIDTVTVRRYHADTDELTIKQQDGVVKWCYDHQDVPYDYLDIVALLVLMNINDTSWLSFILRKAFSWGLHIVEHEVDAFIAVHNAIAKQILGDSVKANKGLLICSQADYLSKVEGAGVNLKISNHIGREKFDKANGEAIELFRQINQEELMNPNISFFVTPRDIAMCDDLKYMGVLKL